MDRAPRVEPIFGLGARIGQRRLTGRGRRSRMRHGSASRFSGAPRFGAGGFARRVRVRERLQRQGVACGEHPAARGGGGSARGCACCRARRCEESVHGAGRFGRTRREGAGTRAAHGAHIEIDRGDSEVRVQERRRRDGRDRVYPRREGLRPRLRAQANRDVLPWHHAGLPGFRGQRVFAHVEHQSRKKMLVQNSIGVLQGKTLVHVGSEASLDKIRALATDFLRDVASK